MCASSDGTADGLHNQSLPGPLRTCTWLGLSRNNIRVPSKPVTRRDYLRVNGSQLQDLPMPRGHTAITLRNITRSPGMIPGATLEETRRNFVVVQLL